MVLRHRQKLGLTPQQVESLQKPGMDFRRAAIRRTADRQLAQLDLYLGGHDNHPAPPLIARR
jgi:hypothetical protein